MVTYNKTLVTVSLVLIFIIGVIEYVIGSYLSQHLLEAWSGLYEFTSVSGICSFCHEKGLFISKSFSMGYE